MNAPRLFVKAVLTALLTALVAALLTYPAFAEDGYETYLDKAYAADGPGATAIVVRDGEVLYRGARGMADLELGVPLAPGHVFRLGSITKQFTAAAILLLVQDGKVALDAEITTYLPDYPTHGHRITVEHLLTHTSGIFSYTSIPGYITGPDSRADLSTEELIDVFDELEMDFAPGEQWSYDNSGYVLLGAIIEAASGLSYADFVQQRIFDPLEMNDSHYGGPQLIPRRVEGYSGTVGSYANAPFLSMTQPHAAGSLLSTVDDLARWNAGLFGGNLVTAESVERMTRPYALTNGDETGYGYGLGISDFRGQASIAHGGGIHGFSTYAMWLPESKIYVAVLSNNPENPRGPGLVAQQMAALALDKPFTRFTALGSDPKVLGEYVGVYRIDESSTRTVTLADNGIQTQRTGGPAVPAFRHAEDSFFYANSLTHLVFMRDSEGKVVGMRLFANGAEEGEEAEKIADTVPGAASERQAAEVSPELYDLWAGRYEIRPGFELVITRDGDRLISQATGQTAFELFPASAQRYFVRDFEAELEFTLGEDGRASQVVLYQGGQEIPAKRLE